jgi:hypothetical protein
LYLARELGSWVCLLALLSLFGAATVGPPPTVVFDNIIATTPGGE